MYNPQKAINSILERYSGDQLLNMLEGSSLGLKWSAVAVYNYFVGCIRMGVTENTVKMMEGMIRFCEKHQKYEELIYTYEHNLSRLFIFLKYVLYVC